MLRAGTERDSVYRKRLETSPPRVCRGECLPPDRPLPFRLRPTFPEFGNERPFGRSSLVASFGCEMGILRKKGVEVRSGSDFSQKCFNGRIVRQTSRYFKRMNLRIVILFQTNLCSRSKSPCRPDRAPGVLSFNDARPAASKPRPDHRSASIP